MPNRLVWCDIPCTDLARATRFSSAVLGAEVAKAMNFPGLSVTVLPHDAGGVSGCIFANAKDKPGETGPLVYLSCEGRLDEAVAAVEPAGGKVLKTPHTIGPYGTRAIILDSEGNRIALHTS